MSILRKAGTAAAISVAGAGIAVGGIGLASAGDSTSGQDSTTQANPPTVDGSTAASSMPGEGRGHGRGGHGGRGDLSTSLADALGIPEADVSAALQTVREQLASEKSAEGEARTRPSEADREARQAEMTAALADELGVSEQKITDALESMTADRMEQGRSALEERLDAAVDDGSLTEADKESVLKALDAGVLGAGRHGPDADDAAGTDS